jgi:pyroglutamyl-peptidase
MAVMRILVTGFEPFGGQSLNPSWEVARALNGFALEGAQVVSVQLPCVFVQALPALQQALAQHRPDIVLALGQAEGRCDFSVERVAINVMDARIADNAGAQPIDVPVIAGGPAAYFSTLPIKALVAGLRAGGFPASVSHALAGLGVHSGFVHLPLLPEQAAHWKGPTLPSWPASLQIAAAQHALKVLVAHRQQGLGDVALSGGTLN